MVDGKMLIEIVGYIGSVLVVVSMLMSSVIKLRIFNVIGSIISLTYAFIVGAIPLVLMNACLIVINVYNLFKLLKSQKDFDLIEAESKDSFVTYIVNKYKDDIKTYFPAFDENDRGNAAFVVCCEGKPAGVLLGNVNEDKLFDILIDYSTPEYRDCSVAKFIFSNISPKDISKFQYSKETTEAHISYMNKMGFEKQGNIYVKNII